MIRYLYFLILFCLLLKTVAASETAATSDGDLSGTFVGWTGNNGDLSGIPQQTTDIWTGRSSWNDLQNVGWPKANSTFSAYLKNNPNGAVDFATAIIPHGLPSSQWNGLLDQVVSGAEDSVFVAEGQNMAKYSNQIVYCRPWWEMTMSTTNLDPTKFKAAWNHAIPIIRSAFAAAAPTKTLKIAYCYLPNAQGDPQAYFPGPANVDVIDADIYGKVWGRTTPTQTALLAAVQTDLNYLAAFAAAENKPAGVSEWGNFAVQTQGQSTNQGRGDDPEYIDLMLSFAAQNHFLYMDYFNLSSGGVGQTFANTPLSLAHFRAALTSLPAASASTAPSATTSAPMTTTASPAVVTSAPTTTTASPAATTSSATTTTASSAVVTSSGTTTGSSPAVATSSPTTTTFSAWQAKYFTPAQLANPAASGPTSDPYGSGIPNLLAYALQLDPSTARASDVPQPTAKNGHLVMSYQVPSALTDVDFIPEVSSDLRNWSSDSSSVQVVSSTVGPNGETYTVEDCLPTTTTKRFMRLRVTQQ